MSYTTSESEPSALPVNRPSSKHGGIWKGILWQQWLAQGAVVRVFLAAWLVCAWVLPLLSHPPLIMAFAVIYAAWAGQAFGGPETLDNTEEFTFSLPPRRANLYLTHLAIGLAPLVLFAVGGVIAIAFDLPQRLWSLVLESGLTEGYGPAWPVPLYLIAILLPIAVYSFSFTVSAVGSTRSVVSQAWAIGTVAALYVAAIALIVERELWWGVTGRLSCPILLLSSGLALATGYQTYVNKEGVGRPLALGDRSRWLILTVAIFLAGALIVMVRNIRT